MRRLLLCSPAVSVSLALAGCSFVVSFDAYTSGQVDAGGGTSDAAPSPPTPEADASPGEAGPDDASCGDVLSSPQNCGSCGHDCLGDGCENGRCVATPITTTAAGGHGIDVDEQNVYWSVSYGDAAGGQLLRIGKNELGGTGVVLVDSPHPRFEPLDVKVDGSYVAVVDGSPGNGTEIVYRVATAGGSVAALGRCASDGVSGLAVSTTDFYAVSNRLEGPNLIRIAKSGAGCGSVVSEGYDGLYQIALDDGVLYFTQPGGQAPDGSLFAVPIGSSTPVAIAADTVTGAWSVLPDGDSLIVATEQGGVLRVAKDGSATEPLTTEVEGLPRGLAADAQHVYWSNAVAGEIVEYDRLTRARRVLASGQDGVQQIAADATHLYWTTDTHVMRLTK